VNSEPVDGAEKRAIERIGERIEWRQEIWKRRIEWRWEIWKRRIEWRREIWKRRIPRQDYPTRKDEAGRERVS
jgi:hypothetical protein